ncbi:uncharacterized protein LOC128218025 [Mya arenaria]|uniref:uncharacterized protein LOC128218025 n=1 Tax=Mya arenaria TaxID=6604 RepID=UPI0022E4D03E|nr:uncharacterized protein LOC128218025 [Mya arenaria]XP_052781495.1 uncharacterized protein LOC128218025 [Mya arenaria]
MASKFESSIQRGCDFIHDFVCSPCEEDRLNTEAQYFCNQCTKYYCVNCVPVHNKLFKRHSVLDRKDVKKWAAAPGTVDVLERCERHPGEALKLICGDHDQLCCHVCVAVDHRLCSSIQHIPDVARDIRKDPGFRQLPQQVAVLRKQIEDMKNDRKKNSSSLRKTRTAIVDEIKAIRKMINGMLDKMEKTTVQELDRLVADQEMSIKKDMESCTQMHDELKNIIDDIQSKDSSGEPPLYIGFKKCEEKIKQAKEILQNMSSVVKYDLTFRKHNGIEDNLSSMKTFGELNESNVLCKQPCTSLFPRDHVFATEGYKEYNVKMSSDKDRCDIYGMCELPGGEIVITDYNNMTVKLLDQEYRVVDHCDVPKYPLDVCHIGGNEVALCVNNDDRHELHFINITKGKLVTTRKLSFSHECYGATHHGNNLYISSRTALYVYTMTGKRVKTLYEDESFGYTVRRFAISNDGKTIYITNYSNNQLITLDNLGNKLATFTDPDLRGPSGVHATTSGHVFVCCYYSQTVLQVDKDGKTKLATLARQQDGVYFPQALYFSSRSSSLVVGGVKDTLLVINVQ